MMDTASRRARVRIVLQPAKATATRGTGVENQTGVSLRSSMSKVGLRRSCLSQTKSNHESAKPANQPVPAKMAVSSVRRRTSQLPLRPTACSKPNSSVRSLRAMRLMVATTSAITIATTTSTMPKIRRNKSSPVSMASFVRR